MSKAFEAVMESREELMISHVGDSRITRRIAHFLQPSVDSNEDTGSEFLSSSSSLLPPTFEPNNWPLTVTFSGWPFPPTKWVQWVDSMRPSFESVWREVGIFEAIMGTKCRILKNIDLVFGIAERWCSQTNTFVFPWGEATITLEDMMFLEGYPVLGDSVFKPLNIEKLKRVEEKLRLARKETRKKCIHKWMSKFMNSGNEIEHEAFLAAWLCAFVFPGKSFSMRDLAFPNAIHLARGNALALAPAVLATIYKDLNMLKQTIVDLNKSRLDGDLKQFKLLLHSPLYLVQVWMWERFHVLQPNPKPIKKGDTLLIRWHKVNALKIDNVRSVLDSAKEEFIWRPYLRFRGNKIKSFYAEKPLCVVIDDTLDKELESYIICMRVSELVGLDCIEQYLPHRVAMQFGVDQDIPGFVARINDTPEIAWSHYIRPIKDGNVYFPPRFFKADVTARYADWWKKSELGHDHQDRVNNLVQRKKRHNDYDVDGHVPPGFCNRCKKVLVRNNFDGNFGTGENGTDSNGVLPPTAEANETEDSMVMSVKKLQQISENVNVVREPEIAKEDAKSDELLCPFSTTSSSMASLGEAKEDAKSVKLSPFAAASSIAGLGEAKQDARSDELSPSAAASSMAGLAEAKEDAKSDDHSSVAATSSMAGLGEVKEDEKSDDHNSFAATPMEGLGDVNEDAANGVLVSSMAHEKVNVSCAEREDIGNEVNMLIMDIDNRISRLENMLKVKRCQVKLKIRTPNNRI